MTPPQKISIEELCSNDWGKTAVYASPSVESATFSILQHERMELAAVPPDDLDTIMVVGGGRLIDRIKYIAHHLERKVCLVAIPSIWGSGAEVSPIVVLNDKHGKTIELDTKFLPDYYALLPQLTTTIPHNLAVFACGDVWSHAMEALFSPLAGDSDRAELAELLKRMLNLPLAIHDDWFDASAQATLIQARTSVGVVHGIAHVLEPEMPFGKEPGGHARLCSRFLWPAMTLMRERSRKWSMLEETGLDIAAMENVWRQLFSSAKCDFCNCEPLLQQHWDEVLREPSTRTNGVLIRRQDLEFFLSFHH